MPGDNGDPANGLAERLKRSRRPRSGVPDGPRRPNDRHPLHPGSSFELCGLTFTVPTDAMSSIGVVERLRRARAAGFTTFDTVGSAAPEAAEASLARAFPGGDPAIVVLAPTTSRAAEGSAVDGPPGHPPEPARAPRRGPADLPVATGLRHLYARAPRRPIDRATPADPTRPSGLGTLTVLDCRSVEDLQAASREPTPRVLSGPCSLLAPELLAAAESTFGAREFAWIARDPFAGGRLDGSRYRAAPGFPPRARPVSVRELEDDFAQVAPFGFLALPHRRTLAQAALWFAVDRPPVVTTVLDLPAADRWDELVGFDRSPPLRPDERERAEALGARSLRRPSPPFLGP